MITVHKFKLEIEYEQTVDMPAGAGPLSVGHQGGLLYLWAKVNTSKKPVPVKIYLRGTGHPFTGKEGRFIGTAHMPSGLVWHVFEGL